MTPGIETKEARAALKAAQAALEGAKAAVATSGAEAEAALEDAKAALEASGVETGTSRVTSLVSSNGQSCSGGAAVNAPTTSGILERLASEVQRGRPIEDVVRQASQVSSEADAKWLQALAENHGGARDSLIEGLEKLAAEVGARVSGGEPPRAGAGEAERGRSPKGETADASGGSATEAQETDSGVFSFSSPAASAETDMARGGVGGVFSFENPEAVAIVPEKPAKFDIGGDSGAEEVTGTGGERARSSEVATCTAAKGPAWQAEQRAAVGGSCDQGKRGRSSEEATEVAVPGGEEKREIFYPGTRVQFVGLRRIKFTHPDGKVIRGRDLDVEIGIVKGHLLERHAVQVVRENDDVVIVQEANVERVRDASRADALTMTLDEFAELAEDVMEEALAGARGLDKEQVHLRVLRLAANKCDHFEERTRRQEGFARSIAHLADCLMEMRESADAVEVGESTDAEPEDSAINL